MSEKVKKSRKNNGLSEGKREVIRKLLTEYDISSISSIEEAIKDLLGDTIKELMAARYGVLDIKVPQDRNSEYSPTVIPKGEKDISHIDEKIINLYARGNSTKEISKIIEDIYGFDVDDSFVSRVTDKILPIAQEWNTRTLKSMYLIVL